jgi:hypothetical protein
VVRLHLTDQPAAKTLWWFVNQGGACELCLEDPGFEIDLYLACTLVTMIRIVRGDVALDTALASQELEAIGSAAARRALRPWLNLSPIVNIPSQRVDAAA